MTQTCYLTIDDSPSVHTNDLIDFLVNRNIPALLFVRGDLLEANPAPIIRAIQKGFVIGNHSYSHRPFGELSYEEAIEEIDRCDALIDQVYKDAGIKRHGYYFRFPYLDRGNGDRVERHFENVSDVNINDDPKVQALQNYLRDKGYHQPFQTDHPLYLNKSIAQSVDSMMTYSSFDWMMTNRHRGQWDYKTVDDLKRKIDDDKDLQKYFGNILIFHDQDETFETFKSLIDYMVNGGYKFIPVET